MNLNNFLKDAKDKGQKILGFTLAEDRCSIVTTEKITDFPELFGKVLACTVNTLYKNGNKRFSRAQILDSILAAAIPAAERMLQQDDQNDEGSKSATG